MYLQLCWQRNVLHGEDGRHMAGVDNGQNLVTRETIRQGSLTGIFFPPFNHPLPEMLSFSDPCHRVH